MWCRSSVVTILLCVPAIVLSSRITKRSNDGPVEVIYVGCYVDNGAGKRLMTGIQQNFDQTLTPDICNTFCFDRGFAYSGTQYSIECFCSRTKPPDHKKSDDSECNLKCAGDQSKLCGGNNRLSIRSTGIKDGPVDVNYIGCYVDDGAGNRLMKGFQQNFEKTLTPEMCNSLCFNKGFAYAGTQYSIECFCSTTKPPDYKKAVENECNLKCAGDQAKLCGGNNRLSVRSTGINGSPATDGPVDVKYIGCYVDGGPGNRLMTGIQQNFDQTLTPDTCNAFCFDKGFAYAATQYSIECFCSRTKPPDHKKSADSECNFKCAGDQSKLCGGNNRLSVRSTGIKGSLETGVEEVFKYVGCFKDFSNGTRLMTGYRQDFPDTLSNQLCSKLCRNKQFRYAGMQFGKECFCDNERPSYKHYSNEENCFKRCEGNYLQLCGGDWRISVYETGIPGTSTYEDSGKYIGCYKDQENPRSLGGHMESFGNILTPMRCTGLCYSMGFLYAGTQYSKQCFCGDKHPNPNSKVAEDECSKPCTGDPNKKCGGDYRNSVRETGITDVPVHDKYMGCFNDLNNHILRGHKTTFEKTNTPRRCMNYCWHLGFKYSGVEFGKECLCGSEGPESHSAVSGEECNMPCSGDQLETCGAGWRLAVYATDLQASVIPLIGVSTTSPPSSTNKPCEISETTVNGKRACKKDVIFLDEFSSPLGSKWKHVVKISESPDYEFAMFHANPQNSFVTKNQLVIKPTILDDSQILTGSLNLQGCTGNPGTRECGFQAFSFNILPPVASARINTRQSFTFRYGIVEIKAKLPVGDWLVPELWLEPKIPYYGQNYASGRIRLAMCRGNQQLQCDGQDMSSNHLESGVVMGPDNNTLSRSTTSTVPDNWHDHFHTYTLIWKPDSISFKVDNELEQVIVARGERLCEVIGFTREKCAIWNSGSKIAPFDKDFYISLGLSSGNARDFPDSCINRGKPKPWRNLDLKALLRFWQDKENWSSTWSDEKSALYIEHVRVTAL